MKRPFLICLLFLFMYAQATYGAIERKVYNISLLDSLEAISERYPDIMKVKDYSDEVSGYMISTPNDPDIERVLIIFYRNQVCNVTLNYRSSYLKKKSWYSLVGEKEKLYGEALVDDKNSMVWWDLESRTMFTMTRTRSIENSKWELSVGYSDLVLARKASKVVSR